MKYPARGSVAGRGRLGPGAERLFHDRGKLIPSLQKPSEIRLTLPHGLRPAPACGYRAPRRNGGSDMRGIDRQRGLDLGLALALGLAAWAAGAAALGNGFVAFDDPLYVTRNPVTQQGLTAETVRWAFTTGFAANWHPLTWLSVMLDVELFGLNARGHHAMSLAIHALNTVLVYALMRGLGLRPGPGALAAGLFGLHPLRVESVAWASERKDVLSTFFGLLSLLAYVRYAAAPGLLRMLGVALLLALGLLAKPMLVTLPFVMLLLDWWPLRRVAAPAALASPAAADDATPGAVARVGIVRLVAEKLPLFALVALSSWITYVAQAASGSVALHLPLIVRLANAIHSYVAYLSNSLWPTRLAALYPLPDTIVLERVVVDLLALGVFTFLAWRLRAARPYLLVGWLWFLGTLVPVIGIVQVGMQAYADRYTYLPSIGLALMAAPLLADLASRVRLPRPVAVALAVALLAVLGLLTRAQTRVWANTVSLFEHAVAATGHNPLARMSLASELIETGDLTRAQAVLEEAKAEGAPAEAVHLSLGTIYHRQHRHEEALREFDAVLALKPEEPKALVNRGIMLVELGRNAEAIVALERVVALRGGNDSNVLITAHRTLATALLRVGRQDEAERHRREADAVGGPAR